MAGIGKVGVIGAGVMGGGIAAQVANAGTPVVLLDIVAEGAETRSALSADAIARMRKTRPAPFMEPAAAARITPGNLEDDLSRLAECDWIVEAVVENLDVKQETYREIEEVRKKGSLVTSNTSTIPLGALTEGLPASFVRDFAITHFFNPPRYMRLLEVVAGPKTGAGAIERLCAFADTALGKEVVRCKDTPGFIANRVGIYWSSVAMQEALRAGLTVEEADSIVGRPMGAPKTGIFGLADLTGIDLMPHVERSMRSLLPEGDPFHRVAEAGGALAGLIEGMIAAGYTGRKGKGGFYRLAESNGGRVKEARDLGTGEYRRAEKPELASAKAAKAGLRALVDHPDKGGRYAWAVLSRTLAYAASLVPEISDSLDDVDRAMRAGYAWKHGPFEQIDQLGARWLAERLADEGRPVPALLKTAGVRTFYRERGAAVEALSPEGVYAAVAVSGDAFSLADKKRGREPLAANGSASLWDIDDRVACLEFHSKMNSVDSQTMAMVREAAKVHERGFTALVIGNDGDNFSAGANIGLALFAANTAMWPVIEQTVREGQECYLKLRYAPFPVVGAAAGMALGGGCEVLLHCDAVQAHAETYMGLVEVGVGIVPAWGGTKELVTRHFLDPGRPGGPVSPVARAFETISLAKVSTSAAEARTLLYLRPGDGITMNRARVLADAKRKALELAADYTPPEPQELVLPGASARLALDMVVDGLVGAGKATAHDKTVTAELAAIVSGGDTDLTETVTEKDMLALERGAFLRLIRAPATLRRMEHMLETGKPLRN